MSKVFEGASSYTEDTYTKTHIIVMHDSALHVVMAPKKMVAPVNVFPGERVGEITHGKCDPVVFRIFSFHRT